MLPPSVMMSSPIDSAALPVPPWTESLPSSASDQIVLSSRLTTARIGAETAAAEAAHSPSGRADQCKHDQEREEEAYGERHLRSEQAFKHTRYSPFRYRAPAGSIAR